MEHNEKERLRIAALHRYQILDTSPEDEFDKIARLAAYICQVPISLISFVDQNRQWFKAKIGISTSETPRAIAFCHHTIQQSSLFIIENALHDERFANNPLVTGDPYIRFYAGAPLITPEGDILGTLNVIDTVPKSLTPEQQEFLLTLANQVMIQLRLKISLLNVGHLNEELKSEIDERKRVEKEIIDINENLERLVAERTHQLEESERHYHTLADLSPVGIYRINIKGNCIYANQKACDLSGISMSQALNDEWQSAIYWEDRDMVLKKFNERIVDHATHTLEYRFQHTDGKIVWVFNQCNVEYDSDNNLIGYIGTLTDITKIKEAEHDRQYSETRFRTLVEQAPIGIQILDTSGKTIQVNGAWEKLWTAKFEYLNNYNIFEDEQLKSKGMMHYILKAFNGEATSIPPVYYDPRIATPDIKFETDPSRWIKGYIYPIKDENGDVREIIIMHEDISNEKKAEEELKERGEVLHRLSNRLANAQEDEKRRISQYLHESTAQDLSAIMMRLHLLKSKITKAESTKEFIVNELEELTNLIRITNNDLRALSYSLHPATLINLGLAAALQSLVKEVRAISKVKIVEDIQSKIPRLDIEIESAIYRIAQETLMNAIKHAEAQQILLSLKMAKGELAVEIRDNGRGFDPESSRQRGIGIISMIERASSIKAQLKIESVKKRGTMVTLRKTI
jgi:PAS domain S-box-containing protein